MVDPNIESIVTTDVELDGTNVGEINSKEFGKKEFLLCAEIPENRNRTGAV